MTVNKIYCKTKQTKFKQINVEDTAFILLEYKNGPFVYFRLSTGTYPDLHDELEISGSNGGIVIESINEGGRVTFKQFLKPTNLFNFEPYKNKLINNKLTLQEFVNGIKNNKNNFEEILNTMKIIDKIYLSSKTKKVVK